MKKGDLVQVNRDLALGSRTFDYGTLGILLSNVTYSMPAVALFANNRVEIVALMQSEFEPVDKSRVYTGSPVCTIGS